MHGHGSLADHSGGKYDLMTDYWIYVDDITSRARIHEGSCSHCNYGKGVRGSRLNAFRMVRQIVA